MADKTQGASILGRVLREPTFHFAILAGVLFAVSAVVGSRNRNVIEIDRAEILVRVFQIEASRGAALTPEERRRVEDAYIDEQVLVREALALGLDRDARIHDVLAQKMLHVLSADVIQPSAEELEVFYEANRSRYVPEPAVTADELVLAVDGPLPESLRAQLEEGTPPAGLITEILLSHKVLAQVTREDLASILDPQVAGRVFAAEPGDWVGPHLTVRGQHWLRVTARSGTEPLPLDEVRDQARLDWIVEQETARLALRVAELRERYTIRMSGAEVDEERDP